MPIEGVTYHKPIDVLPVTATNEDTKLGFPSASHVSIITKNTTPPLGVMEQSIGVYQFPHIRKKIDVYYKDPIIQEAVNSFAEDVMSTGIYWSSKDDSQVVSGQTALQYIEDWSDEVSLDIKLIDAIREKRAFGNSYWNISDYGFEKIPLEAVWRWLPIDRTTPLQYKYNLGLDPMYGGGTLEWGKFIHFHTNRIGYKTPFGLGLLDGLLARPRDRFGNIAPSIYDMRISMRTYLMEGFEKFAGGNSFIGVEGMTDEQLKMSGLIEAVRDMSPVGNRIITNAKINIQTEVPQRAQSYDGFVTNMRNEYFMALSDPALKLGLEEGFTKATSESAIKQKDSRIAKERMEIRCTINDVVKHVLIGGGFNPKKARVSLNFGAKDTAEYDAGLIIKAVDSLVITPMQGADMLQRYLHWDIDPNLGWDNVGNKNYLDTVRKYPSNVQGKESSSTKPIDPKDSTPYDNLGSGRFGQSGKKVSDNPL